MDLVGLTEWGYWGMFFAGLLAGTIVPFSSEVVLLGLLAVGFDALPLLIIASIANWIGGMTTYWVGYLGKTIWLEKYFRVSHTKLIGFKSKINKWGAFLAILSWVPIIGNLITAALGFFKVPLLPVAIYMAIGKITRYILIIYIALQATAN